YSWLPFTASVLVELRVPAARLVMPPLPPEFKVRPPEPKATLPVLDRSRSLARATVTLASSSLPDSVTLRLEPALPKVTLPFGPMLLWLVPSLTFQPAVADCWTEYSWLPFTASVLVEFTA